MGKKTNKPGKTFQTEWKKTLDEKYAAEAKLVRFDNKLAELIKDEEERLTQTIEFPFAVGDRVERKDSYFPLPGIRSGSDFIDRPGTVTGCFLEVHGGDGEYYNPGYVWKPVTALYVNVLWDQTPRQKEKNRKGSENTEIPSQLRKVK
jgi:hypothetical protein